MLGGVKKTRYELFVCLRAAAYDGFVCCSEYDGIYGYSERHHPSEEEEIAFEDGWKLILVQCNSTVVAVL